MSQLPLATRVCASLLAAVTAFGAWAQTLEAPTNPEVGDKWTYRFHNKGDKREPYLYNNQVRFLDADSAWTYGESQENPAQVTTSVWRFDLKRAAYVERFNSDPAAANGAGKRTIDRTSSDGALQFPLAVGKRFRVKFNWDNGRGFDELDAEVQAFEKIKVDGGEFDAYRIKYSGFWNQREGVNYSGRVERTNWYAPAVKGLVKFTYINHQRNGLVWNDTVTELVKWEPAAPK